MHRLASIAATLLVGATYASAPDARAQTVLEGPVQLAWSQSYDLAVPLPYPGRATDSVSDGQRVYVLSELAASSVLRAFDGTSGALAWQLEYAGPAVLGAHLNEIVLSADGATLVAVGHAQLQNGPKLVAHGAWLRIDAGNGALLASALDAQAGSSYARVALAEDASALYVLGQHKLDAATPGALISARYALDGSLAWRTLEPGSAAQQFVAQDVALGANGTLLRAWTRIEETDDDPIELAFAVGGPSADGSVAWQYGWQDTAGPLGWHMTADGAHAILSNLQGSMPHAQRVATATGAITWAWPTLASDGAQGVGFDALTQRVYVMWEPDGSSFTDRSFTALDASGAVIWSEILDDMRLERVEFEIDHALSRVHVAGALASPSIIRQAVASVSMTDGELAWQHTGMVGHWIGAHVLVDGSLGLAGEETTQMLGADWRISLAQIDGSTGAGIAWHGSAGNGQGSDKLESVERSADGAHLLLAGTADAVPVFALAHSELGALIWQKDLTAVTPVGLVAGRFESAFVHEGLCILTGMRGANPFVHAVARATGETVWTLGVPPAPTGITNAGVSNAALSTDGSAIYVAYGQGPTFALRSIELATGAELWSTPVDAQPDRTNSVRVSPDGTRVYLASSKSQLASVRAFDASSGALLWHHVDDLALPFNVHWFIPEDLAISADGKMLVACYEKGLSNAPERTTKLRSLDALSGAPLALVDANMDGAHSLEPHELRISADGTRVYLSSTAIDTQAFVPYTRVDAYALPALTHVWRRATDIDIVPTPPSLELDADGTKLYVAGGAFWIDYMAKVLAISAGDGFTRWAAEHTTKDLLNLPHVAGLALDAHERQLFAAGQAKEADTLDWRVWAYDLPGMTQSASSISLASGGAVNLEVSVGPQHGGAWRLVLGSVSGSTPGLQIAGVHLPLNVDAYFLHTLQTPNTPPLVRNLAPLSAQGAGSARFALPAGSLASLAGLELTHAAVVFDASFAPELVTNPVSFVLQP